jgi:chromosomal replication initiator protein
VNEAETLWKRCADILRLQVQEAAWLTSLAGLCPGSFDGEWLVLVAPSTWARDRVESRFIGLIASVVSDIAERDVKIRLEVARVPVGESAATVEEAAPTIGSVPGHDLVGTEHYEATLGEVSSTLSAGHSSSTRVRAAGPAGSPPEWDEEPHSGGLDPRYTFEAFVTGSSNRFAHAAAQSVAEMPARSYNPLFIHGGAGLGKTHLLHAIGNYVLENFAGKHLLYVSTETFMNEFVDAIRNHTMPAFKRHYRECDVLLIDDIQFLEGKEALQEEFFHTFNHLYSGSKQIVLTSDRPPKSIATLEDRLSSRFLSGLITDVQPPELETRLAILHKKSESNPAPVPSEVLEFIATNVKDNIRELEGALIRVSAYGSLTRQPLSRELAERVLYDIVLTDQPRRITAQEILDATSAAFGFTIADLCSPSRRRPLVIARQVGMYVFREVTDFSYPAIAREFGGRDHTTVMHAVEKISKLMSERRQIYDQVTELILKIKSGQ